MSWQVAGAGALASVGSSADEVFAALCEGRTGLAPLRAFDAARFRASRAYEIDDRPAPGADRPGRATEWLLRAIEEAVADAGLSADLSGIPVLIGTGLRELRSVELSCRGQAPADPDRLHFGTALRQRFGAEQTYTFANACSASLYALALGADLLAAGSTGTVIVAGTDALTESMYGLLDRVQIVPPDQVRPFGQARRGTLLGEGAAAVVLRADADPRGSARGWLRSVGVNCDAHHVTAPDPRGMAAAMRDAHDRAGVKPRDIDLVLLHGTGTPLNDEAEAAAIREVYGPGAGRPLMGAVKSMTGHTSGGSGLLSLIVALRALSSGRVPPVPGLGEPMAGAAGFRFGAGGRPGRRLRLAQVNAFGFGGVNAVAVVEGPER